MKVDFVCEDFFSRDLFTDGQQIDGKLEVNIQRVDLIQMILNGKVNLFILLPLGQEIYVYNNLVRTLHGSQLEILLVYIKFKKNSLDL